MAVAIAKFGTAEAAGLEQLKTALLTKRGASLRKSGMLFLCRLWVRKIALAHLPRPEPRYPCRGPPAETRARAVSRVRPPPGLPVQVVDAAQHSAETGHAGAAPGGCPSDGHDQLLPGALRPDVGLRRLRVGPSARGAGAQKPRCSRRLCPPRVLHATQRGGCEPTGGCLALARHGCPSPALSPANARLQ